MTAAIGSSAIADVDDIGPPVLPGDGRRPRMTSAKLTMVALVAPSVFLLLLINGYPFVYAGIQSVHNGTLLTAGNTVGLSNYHTELSSDAFWAATRFTALFTVVGVFGSWVVGLGMALLLRSDLPGRNVFKVLLLLPWVVPIVVSATSINYLVATADSPMPRLFDALGLGSPLFLANPHWAKVVVCVYKVWVSFPFMMLMTSAALSSVDENVYEAARIDSASAFQTFRYITLPMIARPTYISWILMTIFCVNDFPTIFLLTGGGPINSTTSLVVLSYRTVFQNFQVGQGVAIAFMMTLVLVLVSLVLYRQIRKSAYL
jgi:multiple sugar transport system permease protein